MVYLTGLRPPAKQLTYRADQGGVRINLDRPTSRNGICRHFAMVRTAATLQARRSALRLLRPTGYRRVGRLSSAYPS